MSFFVRDLNGQTHTIQLEPGLTVSEAKKELASKHQIDPSQIRLIFGGNELQDDSSFYDGGVVGGSTVTMALRDTKSAAFQFHVVISGARGDHAAAINGAYYSSGEICDGHPLLRKSNDASVLIEHFGGMWQIKPASCQGEDLCFARVPGGCALAACTSRQFTVSDGKSLLSDKNFIDAPGVKIETGAEAERKVSGCCLRAHQHALLPPVGASNPITSCDTICAGLQG
jgi:hypothetical protein